MAQRRMSFDEFVALVEGFGDGVPDGKAYVEMGGSIVDLPGHEALLGLDPFSDAYRQGVMDLYLRVRGWKDEGYDARRDERPATELPGNVWTGLVPWSFRDAGMASEHLTAWGHIFSELKVAPGGSVLEYGPGSGQMLLMLARMGYRAFGVDVDEVALRSIAAQAGPLGLDVRTEKAVFGAGFEEERFDAIVFYEAFHHAFDFLALLKTLRTRLRPGGRLVLGGEPILAETGPVLPYPWGLRLDALSLFCVKRFGWMELGFTDAFFGEAARRTGWNLSRRPLPHCPRASLFVLDGDAEALNRERERRLAELMAANQVLEAEREALRRALQEAERERAGFVAARDRLEEDLRTERRVASSIRASTSWRMTAPVRSVKDFITGGRR